MVADVIMMSLTNISRSLLTIPLFVALIPLAQANPDFSFDAPTNVQQRRDMSAMLNRFLGTTEAQKPEVDRIVQACQLKVEVIREDSQISEDEKKAQIRLAWDDAASDLKKVLTPDQMEKLKSIRGRLEGASGGKKPSFMPSIGIRYDLYFPSDSTTRSIFGNSPASIGLSFRPTSSNRNANGRVAFSLDTFRIQSSGNNVFVLSPQIAYERRTPVSESLTAFYRVSGGPAYIDYSYDDLSNAHFGAKRLGASLGFSTGLRHGPVQLSATYRFVTKTAPINFDGLQLSLAWTFRF